jgi:hypothetical protein
MGKKEEEIAPRPRNKSGDPITPIRVIARGFADKVIELAEQKRKLRDNSFTGRSNEENTPSTENGERPN